MTLGEDVRRMSGSVTNGSTMLSTTCDATRSVLIPSRPTAMATTSEGTMPRQRVTRRVRTGCAARKKRQPEFAVGVREKKGRGGEDRGRKLTDMLH